MPARMPAAPDGDEVKAAIVASVFNKRDQDGNLEENLVDYLEVHEDGNKTRFLILAVTKLGKCVMHKARRNSNGTFSVGKTWNMDDTRQVEQIGPLHFALTMTQRTYEWTTDNRGDLTVFLNNYVKMYRKSRNGQMPSLVNFIPADAGFGHAPQPQAFQQQHQQQYQRQAPPALAAPTPIPQQQHQQSPYGHRAQQPSVSSLVPGQVMPSSGLVPTHGRSPSASSSSTSPMMHQSAQMHAPHPPSSHRSLRTDASSMSPGSHHSELAPPGRGMRSGSFGSDAGAASVRSAGGQPPEPGGFARRGSGAATPSQPIGVGGPGGFAGRGSGATPPSQHQQLPPTVVPQLQQPGGYGIGLGRPGARRQGSGDDRPPARRQGSGDDRQPVGQRLESAASSYPPQAGQRRPSASSDIHPVMEAAYEDDDPYGGMEMDEEVLIPPVASQPLIPPVVNEPPRPSASGRQTPSSLSSQRGTPAGKASPNMPTQPALALDTGLAPPAHKKDRPVSPVSPVSPETPSGGQQRRVSFCPPPLTTAYSRDVLLTSRGLLGTDVTMAHDDDEAGDAIMANVEEMIEGFDWTAATSATGEARSKGTDAIEGRLLDELSALESANIHAFLESDDRIDQVLTHIDEALAELDDIDMQLTGYRMQLNVVSEDIAYIEGQNRGLQVQTSNQHALLAEVRQLLQITDVPKQELQVLSQVTPSTKNGVAQLESAAASLYKALQASKDTATEVAATGAHIQAYRDASTAFSSRVLEYLDIAFKHQADETLATFRKQSATERSLKLTPHLALGTTLMGYEGLVLYVKDMDGERYKKLCLNYITTISKLHQSEMSELLMNLIKTLKPKQANAALPTDVAFAMATGAPVKSTAIGAGVVRSKTVSRRGPQDGKRAEKRGDEATRKVTEMYSNGMSEVVSQIVSEEEFISAFLHLGDNESTFADFMELDTYFRRQAARHASGMTSSLQQIQRSVMDLMFGFVDGEFKNWIDAAIQGDTAAIVGIVRTTEQLALEAQQEGSSIFLSKLLEKQLGRQRQVFDRFIDEQVKTIDGAKVTIKKRRGVFYFVRHFPVFVDRIECQLDNCDELQIRKRVNDAYERVVASVLGSLQHVSKIVAAETSSGEDKGQLYFHVVMIENLNVFVEEVGHLNVAALAVFLKRAKGLYEENRKAYVKMMLRRSFSRLIDFMDGVERLLKTTPATEVHLHSSYNRSALKKVIKDTGAKDMRKAVEAMARRVDKHFTHDDDGPGGAGGAPGALPTAHDPATQALIGSMWREISSELRRETERAADYIAKSYADSGLQLEFNTRDVEAVCIKTKRTA